MTNLHDIPIYNSIRPRPLLRENQRNSAFIAFPVKAEGVEAYLSSRRAVSSQKEEGCEHPPFCLRRDENLLK